MSWINDSLIVYSKISKPMKNGSKFFDLYSYDIPEKKEERLTEGLRLYSPVVYNDKISLKREASVMEIAKGVIFLLSGDSSYITGQNLVLDGSMVVTE